MIDYPPEDFPVDIELTELLSPGGKRVALLTVTNGSDRRPATLGPVGLSNIDRVLDNIAKTNDVDAVIVTGVGRTFCAGANLDMLSTPPSRESALLLAREGHRVLSRLSALGIPTVAAINGVALGGGLEFALHCTHRIALDSAGPLGLPEVGLGLVPGWGGATLLPRLVGWDHALRIIVDNAISGKTMSANDAENIGVIDRVVSDVTTGGLDFIDELDAFSRPAAPTETSDVAELGADTLARYSGRAGNPVDALSHLASIFALGPDASIEDSFEAEDHALSTLMMTPEFRRRLYAFRVTSAASKPPVGTPDVAPRDITRAGVVGAGLMASQIALALAEGLAVPVVISDVAQERLDAARERIDGWLQTRVTKRTLTSEMADAIRQRIHPTLALEDFAECDLVIEAVFEDLTVKKDVLTRLEKVVSADAILASNTSSLSIDTMATFVDNSHRIAGIHFFNPVSAMKLVEVVRGTQMSDDVLATAIDVTRRLRKTPVLVADRPGFVVNRLLSTFLGESLRLVENGIDPDDVTAALVPLRLPMSPFALIDLIGRTVTLKMMQSLEASAPERFFVGDALPQLAETATSSPIAEDLRGLIESPSAMDRSEIHDTIVDALAREVQVMMSEAVIGTVSDIDLCLINGAGWPSAIGGLTPYLDGCGASIRSTGALFHPAANFA